MKSKNEIIENIDASKTYIGSYVIARIKEVECDDVYSPIVLKKGDVIRVTLGLKPRPSVIIKVTANYVITIPLTSSENVQKLSERKSRFFKDGHFTNNYVVLDYDYCIKNFMGVYDNMKLLNLAIKDLRMFIVKNI